MSDVRGQTGGKFSLTWTRAREASPSCSSVAGDSVETIRRSVDLSIIYLLSQLNLSAILHPLMEIIDNLWEQLTSKVDILPLTLVKCGNILYKAQSYILLSKEFGRI